MENYTCISKTLTLIPEDLIFDNILPRLPVKSLLRFKSVSKTWYNVICTPQFTISHLHFQPSFSPHFFLNNQDDIYTLAYNQHDNLKELVKLEQPCHYTIELVGCCNGLICLSLTQDSEVDTCGNMFIVWNPATRQHRNIIRIPSRLLSEMYRYGFGYYKVGSTDDYKIVARFDCDNYLWVFSLRLGHWRSIRFPSNRNHPFNIVLNSAHNHIGIHLDGTLYWSAFRDDSICIYGFSLIHELFNLEASFLKTENMKSRIEIPKLLVFKGCLSLLFHSWHRCVFVMKKEGDSTLWQKLFSIREVCISNCIAIIVDFSITGKALVIQSYIDQNPHLWRSELKLVDPTLDNLEHPQGIGFQDAIVEMAAPYIESLVSPFTLM